MMAITIFMQSKLPGRISAQFSSGIQKRIAAAQHGIGKSSDV
jgi:hypothetical protein